MKVQYNGRFYEFRNCDVENVTADELQRLANKNGHMQYEPNGAWLVVDGIGYGWETEPDEPENIETENNSNDTTIDEVVTMKKLNVNTNGNRKLQNTDTIRYMIWNLPAVKTCPFRTEMCEKSCYARKAERIYPQVLPSREQNYTDSLKSDFVPNMIYTIEKYLNSKAFNGKKCVFRIHESGDFYNVEYADKWVEIAKHFTDDERIVFLAYTKSITYFDFTALPKNLVIRSSLWKDTAPDKVEYTKLHNIPIYTAGTDAEVVQMKHDGYRVCKCENCSNCRMCWNREIKDITCKIH